VQLLSENRERLEALGDALFRAETLEGPEAYAAAASRFRPRPKRPPKTKRRRIAHLERHARRGHDLPVLTQRSSDRALAERSTQARNVMLQRIAPGRCKSVARRGSAPHDGGSDVAAAAASVLASQQRRDRS
jgi:hypothetical protein